MCVEFAVVDTGSDVCTLLVRMHRVGSSTSRHVVAGCPRRTLADEYDKIVFAVQSSYSSLECIEVCGIAVVSLCFCSTSGSNATC